MAPMSRLHIVSDALGKRKREFDSSVNYSMKKLVPNAAINSSLTTFPSSPYIGGGTNITLSPTIRSSLQLSNIQLLSKSLATRPRPLHALHQNLHSHQDGQLSMMTKRASSSTSGGAIIARFGREPEAREANDRCARLEAEIRSLRNEMQAMQRNISQWQPEVHEGNAGQLKEQYGRIVQKVDEQRDLRRVVDATANSGPPKKEGQGGDAVGVAQKPVSSKGGVPKQGVDEGLPGKDPQASIAPPANLEAGLLERLRTLLGDDAEQKSRDLEIKLTEANLAVQAQRRLKLTEEVKEKESQADEGEEEVTDEATEDGTEEEEEGETEGEEEETTEEGYEPLTEEEEELVDQILENPASGERCVFHEASNLELSRTQLHCLRPETWLNDEVINLYMVLLKEREIRGDFQDEGDHPVCHFFNSFFYNKLRMDLGEYSYKQVQRWTRRIKYKLRKCDKVVVPIHQGLHWALAVINVRDRQLEYFDSVCDGQGYPFSTKASPETVLEDLAQYIEDESNDKGTGPLDTSGWRRVFHKDTPNQKNSSDCGMFMLKFADYVSKDAAMTFSQTDMWFFRRKLVVELVHLRAD